MRKNVFKSIIGAAAAAMVLGAAVGAASSIDKAPERVEAETATTVYYAVPSSVVGSYSVKCNVNRKGDGDDWMQYDMSLDGTKTYNGNPIYKSSFTDLYNGLGVLQFQLYDGSTHKGQIQPISSWTSVSTYNGKMIVHSDPTNWIDYTYDQDPSSTKNTYYVYDSEGVLGDTLSNIKIYGFASGIKPMSWPGDYVTSHSVPGVSHVYRAQLSVSYTSIIINNGTKQTADVTDASSHVGDVLYIENNEYETNKYTYKWVSLDDLTVADGTYLRGDWTNGWSVSGQETMELNPGNPNEVMVEGIDLGAGGKVKVVTYSNHFPTWRGPSSVDTQDENYPVSTDGDNNAVVEKTGTYNLYVNFNTWTYWFNPTANVDLEKATAFATAFNTAIEGKCTYQGGSPIGPLTTEWGNQGTEFAKLSDGAKEILEKATKSHTVAAIGTFAGKYDYVYGKYGYDNDWTDFADRKPAEINRVVPIFPGLDSKENNNTWLWVVVATAVAGLGVGAFFFIKKRKEDR